LNYQVRQSIVSFHIGNSPGMLFKDMKLKIKTTYETFQVNHQVGILRRGSFKSRTEKWREEIDQLNESVGCLADVKRWAEMFDPGEDCQDFINLMQVIEHDGVRERVAEAYMKRKLFI
jgi:hypothetical protein